MMFWRVSRVLLRELFSTLIEFGNEKILPHSNMAFREVNTQHLVEMRDHPAKTSITVLWNA